MWWRSSKGVTPPEVTEVPFAWGPPRSGPACHRPCGDGGTWVRALTCVRALRRPCRQAAVVADRGRRRVRLGFEAGAPSLSCSVRPSVVRPWHAMRLYAHATTRSDAGSTTTCVFEHRRKTDTGDHYIMEQLNYTKVQLH